MRTLILLWLFVFCASVAMAQNSLDSMGLTGTMADTAVAGRLLNEAKTLNANQKSNNALILLDTAGSIYLKTTGQGSKEYANVLAMQGIALYNKQSIDEALIKFNESVAIREKILNPDHPELAGNYHYIGTCLAIKGNNDLAIIYLNKALQIRIRVLAPHHTDIGKTYSGLGNCYRNKGDYNAGIVFHRKSLDILLFNQGPKDLNVAISYGNIGNCYKGKGEFDRAMEYYQKGLHILLETAGPLHPNAAFMTNLIGLCWQDKGEYDKAIEYAQKAFDMQQKISGINHRSTINYLNQLGIVYQYKGSYVKAIDIHEEVLKLSQGLYGKDHPFCAISMINIGNSYNGLGEYEKGLKYFTAANVLQKAIYKEDDLTMVTIYFNISNSYMGISKFDSALIFTKKGLDIFNKYAPQDKPVIIQIKNNLGHILALKGDYDDAIEVLREAIFLQSSSGNIDFNNLISLNQFFLSNQKLGYIYQIKGKLASSVEWLEKADSAYDDGIKAFVKMRNIGYTIEAKVDLANKNYGMFEGSIATQLQLFKQKKSKAYIIQAFSRSETVKAIELNEVFRAPASIQFADLPNAFLQREHDLRINLTYVEKQRQTLLNKGLPETDTTVLAVSSKIFDLRRAYEALKDTFETQYPQYYKLKYDLSTVSLDYVQDSLLQPHQTLLEYFTGDSSLYIFALRRDTFAVVEVKYGAGPSLDSLVRQLRHGLTDYYIKGSKSAIYLDNTALEYVQAAYVLYQKLIAPVEGLLDTTLIIVPDGVLGYIPFDVLLSKKPAVPTRFHSHAYLGQQRRISYAYSATLLREMRDKRHKTPPTESLLALAPFFRGNATALREQVDTLSDLLALRRDTLSLLPGSGREALVAAKIYQGKALLGQVSSKALLLREAGRYRILHLSTHGKADDKVGDYAYLGFALPGDSLAFDKLYAKDIYNLVLNADLVTLSACETGIGELKRGEGIISLARAFAYAGAKSIVTTLWSVNDLRTGELMERFYKHLHGGMDKDAALWQAKKAFIAAHKKDAAHPYFWSGFIPIGDMRKVEKN